MHRLRIPIRLKFILTFLILVTVVVGLITFSAANSFRTDKQAYVNGLTSMVALGMAEEARSTLAGYRERLRLYVRLVVATDREEADRETLSRTLFEEFPELVAVWIESGEQEQAAVYNVSLLDTIGLAREELRAFEEEHPLPESALASDRPFVRNSTISEDLPCFTLAFTQAIDERSDPLSIKALIRSDRLLQLVSRFSAYEQFLVDSEGGYIAHSNPATVVRHELAVLPADIDILSKDFSGGLTREYDREGTPWIAGFATVDFGAVKAGAQIPRSAAHLASKQLVGRLLLVAGLLLCGVIFGAVIWAHRITRPMERLSSATRDIAKGDFNISVPVDARDEIGDLADSFNQMASELKVRDDRLEETHAQLVQSEKLAAFGQLGAGIAHEVKNPLAGILACAQLAAEEVEPDSTVREDLALIEKESKRCKAIIENLLKFARQEKADLGPTDANEVVDDSIAIVNHQMELNQIHVRRDLGDDLPLVQGNANQLQQVFMNLMINAQQAMEGDKGTIHVSSVLTEDGYVEFRFSDTGPGIPEEIRAKLFEPFFTTKPTGKGTGLGLSVSYGIIQDHGGKIRVESEVGQGTTFVITLPAVETAAAVEQAEQAVPVGAA